LKLPLKVIFGMILEVISVYFWNYFLLFFVSVSHNWVF